MIPKRLHTVLIERCCRSSYVKHFFVRSKLLSPEFLLESSLIIRMSSQSFLDIIAKRRTFYQLGAKSPISDRRIEEIIESVILNVPSAFNSQTVRIILLVKEEHRKLWDIVKEVLTGVVPEDAFPATEKKLNGFQAAYGTVRLILSQKLLHFYLSSESRFYFSIIAPPSKTFRKSLPYMLINFLPGLSSQMACTNSPFGPPWNSKDSEQICSTIIL